MSRPAILVVTGASGAGKTTAVRMIQARGRAGIRCFYFGSPGVPSLEVMHRELGGPEGWQAIATKRWLAQLAAGDDAGSVSVLDGQTRPSFVRAALAGMVAAEVRVDRVGSLIRAPPAGAERARSGANTGSVGADVLQRDNAPVKKHPSPNRPPPSAAAKARVKALSRGEAPVVRDPEEARGVAFVSPGERQAAFARAARKRAAEEKARKK